MTWTNCGRTSSDDDDDVAEDDWVAASRRRRRVSGKLARGNGVPLRKMSVMAAIGIVMWSWRMRLAISKANICAWGACQWGGVIGCHRVEFTIDRALDIVTWIHIDYMYRYR
jgi:hypothetical protein